MRMSTRHRIAFGRSIVRNFLIAFTACALIASLATRVAHLHTSKSVQATCGHAVRQHLDKDATHWIAPLVSLNFFPSPSSPANVVFVELLPPVLVIGQSLYDRPPPHLQPIQI